MSWLARHKVAVGAGVLLTVVAVLIVVYCTMGGDAEPWITEYRLPDNVEPVHYDIFLRPDLEKGTFSGRIKINITVNVERDFILIHGKRLNLQSTQLIDSEEKCIELKNVFEVQANEWWVIQTTQSIPPGDYKIETDFTGSLTKDIVGFYRSVYLTAQNQKRYIASSKFEPTYARLAFPCFDEPDLKATFDVQLVRPTEGYIALSNMDVKSERLHENPEYTIVSFNRTGRMSTYLAVFVVCDFTYLEEKRIGNTSVRVYARESQKNNTREALDLTVNATQYYSDYFGISYPLPKLDLIAIPDFVSGAMENWGLITFRETSLLFDPELNSAGNRQGVSLTVAHEIAHMWFGDLVTMKWWTDLWLNEGFATFMEFKALHHAHPTWDVETQFLVDELQPVLGIDADLSSHPVLQEVGHPDQITSIFDSISYNKGASVIRMLESFMGPENFREGLKQYLKKHSYSNAATIDLWHELENQFKPKSTNVTSIGHIMDTWTRQEGFPLVITSRTGKNTYTLKQKRFLSDPTAKYDVNKSQFKYQWEVPVTYITSEAPTKVQQVMLWSDVDNGRLYHATVREYRRLSAMYQVFQDFLSKPRVGNLFVVSLADSEITRPQKDCLSQVSTGSPETPVTIHIPDNSQWVKFNHKQVGFYRVQYNKDDWLNLIKLLNTTPEALVTADRASLLNDAFSLADARELDYEVALDMIGYLKREEEYVAWAVGGDIANNLLKYLPDLPELKRYFRDLVEDVYKKVTWEVRTVDGHLTRRARVTILDIACTMQLEDALSTASKLFLGWLDKDESVDPDLRVVVYQYGMANTTDEAIWDRLFQKYLTVVNTQDKAKMMYSLAKTPNKELLKKYIELAKNESNVRGQDYFTVLSFIADNPAGTELAWDFYRNNYEYLVERFSLNSRVLGNIILRLTKSFHTKDRLDEMKSFFKKYPKAGAGETARKQALESVSTNMKWMDWNSQRVTNWFKNRYQ